MNEKLTHAQMRAMKGQLRQQIADAIDRLRAAANRPPDFVLAGSHQVAAGWKKRAVAAYFGRHSSGGKRASLWTLRNTLIRLEKLTEELTTPPA